MRLNWKPWLWAGISIWCLLAFLAWHYESTCGVFFSGSCMGQYWDGLRWIILLKWVEPFQTLIGGVAALAAGAFVLIAARQTSEEARASENNKRLQEALVACSIVADEFRDAQIELRGYMPTILYSPPRKPSFVHSATYMPSLHAIDPMLGSIVSAHRRDIEQHFASNTIDYASCNMATAKCYVIWHLLLSISARLSPDGTFDLSNGARLPAGELPRLLGPLGVGPKDIRGLYHLFDWQT